jgi:hypothetical protein
MFREAVPESADSLRISSVLLLLLPPDIRLGFDRIIRNGSGRGSALMRSVHFDGKVYAYLLGLLRRVRAFFSVFLCSRHYGVVAGRTSGRTLARVRAIAWALDICFVAITALSCRYAFTIPIVFSA